MVIYDEYYKDKEVVKVHAANVLARNDQHGIPPSYNVGDPSISQVNPITGTSVQIEYIDNGVPVLLGNNDFIAGSNAVRTKLGGTTREGTELPRMLYITRNCPNLIWELKRYRYALWANKKIDRDKNRKEEPQKKNDHACDALRYGVASRPMVEDLSIPGGDFTTRLPNPMEVPYSTAINPEKGLVDTGLSRDRRLVDDILGTEW